MPFSNECELNNLIMINFKNAGELLLKIFSSKSVQIGLLMMSVKYVLGINGVPLRL